jgi:hypothetical protein
LFRLPLLNCIDNQAPKVFSIIGNSTGFKLVITARDFIKLVGNGLSLGAKLIENRKNSGLPFASFDKPDAVLVINLPVFKIQRKVVNHETILPRSRQAAGSLLRSPRNRENFFDLSRFELQRRIRANNCIANPRYTQLNGSSWTLVWPWIIMLSSPRGSLPTSFHPKRFMVQQDRRRVAPAAITLALWCIYVGACLNATVGTATGAEVSPVGEDSPVSFVNDVVPVLTKAGCNSGVCHAKAGGGQNGFQLSLLGFEPLEDYDHLVLEGRGRRLFPAAPEQSLLLRKVSGRTPHRGGIPLPPESNGYRLLKRWIAQGTPRGDASIQLQALRVIPGEHRLEAGTTKQLSAIAHYKDGSTRDVTRLALFETNDSGMATVTE